MKVHELLRVLGTFLLVQAAPALAGDLSPATWPIDQRTAAEKLEAAAPSPPIARVLENRTGMVAATLSPIAALAGVEALKHDGTAADAAVATALTQIVTGLGANVSYAGILEFVYYEAKSGKVYALNAGWNSWHQEHHLGSLPSPDLSMFGLASPAPSSTHVGAGRKTLVPGFMAGIGAMHARFGKLPLKELCAPALWYAEKGVHVSPLLDAYFRLYSAPLAATASGQGFIQQAGSSTPKIGDLFIQNDLARTLRAVSSSGPSYMYSGQWGRDYVTAVRAAGGAAELADMEQYRPRWSAAVFSTFNGNLIAISGENFGALQIREALNLAEELHVDKMPPYWQDPQSFLALSRILNWVRTTAYDPGAIDRLRMQGIDASPPLRVTLEYAKAVAPLIGSLNVAPPVDTSSHHSAAVVAVDQWGNVAALVHTANSAIWGSTGLVVDGVPIPDAAAVNAAKLAHAVPGHRVANEMSPLIAMRNGKPVLAIATIGSSLIPETMRLLVGVLGNGDDLPAVTAAPPLLLNIEPVLPEVSPAQVPVLVPTNAYSSDFLGRLRAAGINVQERSIRQVAPIKGTAAVIAIDDSSGTRRSAETPGIFSFAAAE